MIYGDIDPQRLAVLIPATNTIVEADFQRLNFPEVTWHYGRVTIDNESLDSDTSFDGFLQGLRRGIPETLQRVLACKPHAIVMGMSAETFWGGIEGNELFERELRQQSGLDIFTGATACSSALGAFSAKRIAILTPYQKVGDVQVEKFFSEAGMDLVEIRGLKCESATAIGRVQPKVILKHFLEMSDLDVDAVVQVGTNLRGAEVADISEHLTGTPVVPVNTAIAWNALRSLGINRQLKGWGGLLEQH